MRFLNPNRIHPILLLGAAALLTVLSSAQSADYYVNPSDANAYSTVQAALDAVSGQSEFIRANIFIAPGTYHELVTVNQPYVSLIGTGSSPDQTTISFAQAYAAGGFDYGETVQIQETALAFMARNLTFENSLPDKNISPALAVRSSADRVIFDNVRVLGYQDTLLLDGASRQYFRNSFVTGDSDFIFGDATVVFDHCMIESTDGGWITASRTSRTTANGFVFLDSSLVPGHDRNLPGNDDTAAEQASVFLGRPWLWWDPSTMSSVIFIRTKMGNHIIPAGWDPWNDPGVPGANSNADRDPLTRYSEFDSMSFNGNLLADNNGDGTPNGRVSWTDPMTEAQAANYTLEHIFGPASFWDSTTQPQASGTVYESQGNPWNPIAQLAFLPTQPGAPSQALNISTRLGVETGDNVLIAGFIVTGTPKSLLLRAIGPSLETAGVGNALADPVLELLDSSGNRIALNDNWRNDNEANIIATGIQPADDHEAALLATLSPGDYTAIVRGAGGSTGVALVEAYDLSGTNSSQLGNISTRGFIAPGGDVMIAGFILAGGTGGAKVIVRAVGPSLIAAGIAHPLDDPILELHDGNGVAIAFNDNWRDNQQADIQATGVPPTNDREAAIVADLPPGSYTAVIADRNGGGGIGLVEVFCLGF